MRTYINATNLGLAMNSRMAHENLYLDVDYQVENSEVAVKSVRFYGDKAAPVLSEVARLEIALQIQDSLVFGY